MKTNVPDIHKCNRIHMYTCGFYDSFNWTRQTRKRFIQFKKKKYFYTNTSLNRYLPPWVGAAASLSSTYVFIYIIGETEFMNKIVLQQEYAADPRARLLGNTKTSGPITGRAQRIDTTQLRTVGRTKWSTDHHRCSLMLIYWLLISSVGTSKWWLLFKWNCIFFYFVDVLLRGGTIFFPRRVSTVVVRLIKQASPPCGECWKYLCGAVAWVRLLWGGLCWAVCAKFNLTSDLKASRAQIWKCKYWFLLPFLLVRHRKSCWFCESRSYCC